MENIKIFGGAETPNSSSTQIQTEPTESQQPQSTEKGDGMISVIVQNQNNNTDPEPPPPAYESDNEQEKKKYMTSTFGIFKSVMLDKGVFTGAMAFVFGKLLRSLITEIVYLILTTISLGMFQYFKKKKYTILRYNPGFITSLNTNKENFKNNKKKIKENMIFTKEIIDKLKENNELKNKCKSYGLNNQHCDILVDKLSVSKNNDDGGDEICSLIKKILNDDSLKCKEISKIIKNIKKTTKDDETVKVTYSFNLITILIELFFTFIVLAVMYKNIVINIFGKSPPEIKEKEETTPLVA